MLSNKKIGTFVKYCEYSCVWRRENIGSRQATLHQRCDLEVEREDLDQWVALILTPGFSRN